MGKAASAVLAIGAIALGGWIAGPAVLGFAAESVGFLVARTVVAMGIMSIGSSILGTNKSESAGAEGTRSSNILANEASGVASLPIIYGRRRIGSRRVYMNVSDSNQKLHMVMALCEGQIGKIRKVYFNDQLVIDMTGGSIDPTITSPTTYMPVQAKTSGRSTTTTSGVSSDVVSTGDARIVSKYRDYVRFEYRLGTTTQEAFSYLTGKFSDWASTAQGKGIALAYFELTYNRDVFTSVPSISYEIDGRIVEDVETPGYYVSGYSDLGTTSTSSLTLASSGTVSVVLADDYDYAASSGILVELYNDATHFMGGTVVSYTPGTKTLVVDLDYSYGTGSYASWDVYNYNSFGAEPASVVYDYLTNSIYGKGIDTANIDLPSFVDAKSYCEQTISLNFQGDIQRLRRYVVNGALNPDDTIYDNIKKLLSSFNGYLVYSNGKYYLKINRELAATQTDDTLVSFDESTIIGKYDLSLGTKATRFNQVKLTHFDRNQNYIANIIYYANSTYLTQDNDTLIERELDLPMVSDPRQACYIAAIALNQSRYSATISFTASFAALRVEVGDVVMLSSRDLGFTDKKFRILSMGLNVDGTVKLDGIEYYDTVYTPGTLPELTVAGTTGRPSDAGDNSNGSTSVVAPPTGVTATAGSTTQSDGTILSKIDVSWTAPASGGIANYEIVLSGTSSGIYSTSGTSYSIGSLPNGTYNVAVRSVNAYGSKSDLVY